MLHVEMIYYPTFFFEFFFQDNALYNTMEYWPEHLLIFIYAGELIIEDEQEKVSLKRGEYIFIRKNFRTRFNKKTCKNEKFEGIFMGFTPCFLKDFFIKNKKNDILCHRKTFSKNIVRLPYTPYLQSMYVSLIPYLKYKHTPCKEILDLKLQEGVYCLLLVDKKFHTCLFDFKTKHPL